MNYKRILVVGCPGGGKSTFARKLAACTGLKLVHLDMLFWNGDKTTVPQEVFIDRLKTELEGDGWIIDGNYASTLEMRMDRCDLVFFLDYPADVCLEGIRNRMGKPRADMPWIETSEDGEFLSFVRNFSEETRPQMLDLLQHYPQKKCIVFRDRPEADAYLEGIRNK